MLVTQPAILDSHTVSVDREGGTCLAFDTAGCAALVLEMQRDRLLASRDVGEGERCIERCRIAERRGLRGDRLGRRRGYGRRVLRVACGRGGQCKSGREQTNPTQPNYFHGVQSMPQPGLIDREQSNAAVFWHITALPK